MRTNLGNVGGEGAHSLVVDPAVSCVHPPRYQSLHQVAVVLSQRQGVSRPARLKLGGARLKLGGARLKLGGARIKLGGARLKLLMYHKVSQVVYDMTSTNTDTTSS